jgi:hypothetical protein
MSWARARRAPSMSPGAIQPWCWVTGGLEIVTATFIAIPLLRSAGIVLGTLVVLAAVATLLRHRAYTQLPPAVAFLVVIALVALTS